MTTLNKTFPFLTTVEGFTGTPGEVDVTMSYDSGVGNPSGSLKTRIIDRNSVGTSYWEWSGTWESLGVPSGSTVSQVRLFGAHNRCTEYVTVDAASIGPISIYDSTGTVLIATLWSGRSVTGVEGSWTSVSTQTYQSIGSSYQASTTSIRLRLYNTLDLGNNASAACSVYDDTISIDIDYTGASDDLTASPIKADPVVGSPTVGQIHGLTASPVKTDSVVGSPVLSEIVNLTSSPIKTDPVVGQPTLTEEAPPDALDASSIKTDPVVGQPTAAHIHNLSADGIKSEPVVGQPTAAHIHNLSADSVKSESVVGQPTVAHIHNLSANGIKSDPVVGTPTIGTEGQDVLQASPIKVGSVVGSPDIGQTHVITADGIYSAVVVGSPSIGVIYDLVPVAIQSSPVVGLPILGQIYALDSASIISSPTVGSPTLVSGAIALDALGVQVAPEVGIAGWVFQGGQIFVAFEALYPEMEFEVK